ncbi:MAG: IS1182 family transposase [Terriglobales bacterium]
MNRAQMEWVELDLENLVEAHHPARAIWELTGKLDLTSFERFILSEQDGSGRPCWPPRLLISVWLYAYSLGIASARAIERMLPYEPGLRWLSADQEVNHHSLSDFRIKHWEALKGLFAQVLSVMDQEGLLDLSTLLQDGTKIQAVAGKQSMHRQTTLRERLQQAQAIVAELDRRAEQELEREEERRVKVQRRMAAERVARMQAALEELDRRQTEVSEEKRKQVRVSESEPEVRKMKQADGGWAPSYNLQVSTEPKLKAIVSVAVSTDANDTQQLQPAVERFFQITARWPEQAIADNGYATRDNVERLGAQGVALIAPWKDEQSRQAGASKVHGRTPEFSGLAFKNDGKDGLLCPAGKRLVKIKTRQQHGLTGDVYVAQAADCASCASQSQCCGKATGPRQVQRTRESPVMNAYLERMRDPEKTALYKLRCAVAEFPHLIVKARWKWRRFSVRGTVKAQTEALWVALAYNVSRWLAAKASAAQVT